MNGLPSVFLITQELQGNFSVGRKIKTKLTSKLKLKLKLNYS